MVKIKYGLSKILIALSSSPTSNIEPFMILQKKPILSFT